MRINKIHFEQKEQTEETKTREPNERNKQKNYAKTNAKIKQKETCVEQETYGERRNSLLFCSNRSNEAVTNGILWRR